MIEISTSFDVSQFRYNPLTPIIWRRWVVPSWSQGEDNVTNWLLRPSLNILPNCVYRQQDLEGMAPNLVWELRNRISKDNYLLRYDWTGASGGIWWYLMSACLGWQHKASPSSRCQWMCFWPSSSKQTTAKVCQLWWFSDRVGCGPDKESKAVPHREIYN